MLYLTLLSIVAATSTPRPSTTTTTAAQSVGVVVLPFPGLSWLLAVVVVGVVSAVVAGL